MANKAISELISAERVSLQDYFLLEQNGIAKNLQGRILKNWLLELAQGHGGITSIDLQSTSGLNKTYRITLADDTYFDMTVADGKGITSVAKTGTSGLVDTYTMKFNAGSDFVFTVKNGEKGDKGDADRLYFKFASQKPTDASHSMGDVPDEWLGFYAGTTPPSGWQDYTWVRIKGDKGDKGDPATLTGRSVTYMVSDSGTIVPSGSWVADVPNVPQGKYLWTRTVLTFNTGNPVTSYSVSRFGIDGSGAVSSVNGKNPDPAGNVRVNAEDITTTAGTSVEAALAQKQEQINASGLLKGTGDGGVANAEAGVDYQVPITAGAGMQISGSKISTAAAPRNLLDNSNFLNPVNQRGKSKYTGVGYTIDRWKLWGDDSTVVVANDGIAVQSSNNYLQQYIEHSKADKNKTYTLAVKTSDGAVEVICGKPDDDVRGTKCTLNTSDYLDAVRISLHPGHTYIWAALYEGTYSADTLPEYQPKGYAEERLACTRYFMVASAWRPIYGNVSWNGQISLTVPTPVEMRINPTGTVIKGTLYVNGVNIDINENPANVIKTSNGLQVILSTKAEANAKHNCTIEINDTAAYFSADL